MKNNLLYYIIGLLVLTASCSDSKDHVSKNTIEDAVNELLEQKMLDQQYTKIRTGYYECNNERTRIVLAKLAAAGVIQYKVERFAWWNKYLYAGQYYGYYYGGERYNFEEHFMVKVGLTNLGKELCVDSVPKPKPIVDEDMQFDVVDATTLPEYKYAKEDWPVIPCPGNEKTIVPEDEDKSDAQESAAEDKPQNLNDIFEETKKEETTSRNETLLPMDIVTKTNYDLALSKVHQKDVIVKSCKLSIETVRYIQTFEDPNSGLNFATAEVIFKMKDVTPAGRIIDQRNEGEKYCTQVRLIYYQDKGWVLPDMSFNLKQESSAISIMLQQIESIKNSQDKVRTAFDYINSMKNSERTEDEYYDYEY